MRPILLHPFLVLLCKKPTMKYHSVFFLTTVFLITCLSSLDHVRACNKLDHDSLLLFLANISSSPPLNWPSSSDCCLWEGIDCDASGRVINIWLPSRGLTGAFSPSIWNLRHLSSLNFSHNLLSGPLGTESSSLLVPLETLDLSYNRFSGKFPSLLPSSLRTVDLSSNFFDGEIPNAFVQLGNLGSLNVSNNSFTGPIPSSICSNSLLSTKFLDFSYNDFSSQIPDGFGKCSKLQVFRAGYNNLSGPIPEDMYKAVELREISVQGNRLSGPINNGIADLKRLKTLQLYANELTGRIPRGIGDLFSLEHLLLHSNNFTGSLPVQLLNCTNLVSLILRLNFLEGDLSALNFSKLLKLQMLDLGNNNFNGSFPVSLYSCKSLVALRLASNQLEGQLLPDLTALQSLSFLSMSANKLTNLTGAIKILMGCKNLSTVILSRNPFNEALLDADSIGKLDGFRNLQLLSIGACQLYGQVPSWLAKLKTLQVLDLSANLLTGTIPVWLGSMPSLLYIDLSGNMISGGLPQELFRLPALTSRRRDFSAQMSHFELPVFVNSTNRQYNRLIFLPPAIYLGYNNLSGKIPIEVGRLKFLHILDLSHNSFSGSIPDELSKLTNLEKLDLSGNRLTGEIPSSLRGLHFLSWFSIAHNNLRGPIPSGGQFDTFSVSSFIGNPSLCGSIRQIVSASQPEAAADPVASEEPSSSSTIFVFAVYAGLGSGFVGGFFWGLLFSIDNLKFLHKLKLKLQQKTRHAIHR